VAILTSFILSLAVSPAAGQVFSDDAERAVMENGVANGWGTYSSATGTPSQVQVHSGKWSYAFQSGQTAYWNDGFTAPDPQYLKFWFYVPSSYSLGGGSSTYLSGFWQTSNDTYYLLQMTNSSGSLYLLLAGTAGTHAITTNAWHTAEFEYSVSGRAATVWLDGTQDITLTGLSLSAMNSVYLGMNGGTGTIYFDDITVSASASGNPTSGLTVRHAYPGNRLAMKIQSYLWGAAATDMLVSSIDGTAFSTISNPGTYQEPILTMTGLSAGNHTLQVQLQTSGGTPRQTWTETIAACGCTPTNGIDAYNNLYHNGNKILPLSSWELNTGDAADWLGYGVTNNMSPPGANAAGWGGTWASSYSTSQYQTFMEDAVSGNVGLNCLNEGDTPIIGPAASRMGGFGTTGTPAGDAANMAGYGAAFTSEACVLAWFGYDEASVNGLTVSWMQGFMNAAHANDNNHAVIYDDATTPFLHLSWYYPNTVADIYSFDDYPLCYSSQFKSAGLQMSDWVHMMDRNERANYGLVPGYQVLELAIWTSSSPSNCTNANVAGTGISNTTAYWEFWMSFIHDRKGIAWYNNISPSGANYGYAPTCVAPLSSPPSTECFPANAGGTPAITPVMSAVSAIGANTLLANPTSRTISTNQTTNCVASPYTADARVDASYKEFGGNIWIFAARLTDPLCNTSENSASALSTTITVSGLSGSATATVYGESRTVPVTSGVLTDSFSPWAVHIYEIPSDPPGVPASPTINGVKTN